MSDPRHPPKIVVVLRGGIVDLVFCDKPIAVKVIIADYDVEGANTVHPTYGLDSHGKGRFLHEEGVLLDTAAVRNIINKKGDV